MIKSVYLPTTVSLSFEMVLSPWLTLMLFLIMLIEWNN